jgi:hypothetical protein
MAHNTGKPGPTPGLGTYLARLAAHLKEREQNWAKLSPQRRAELQTHIQALYKDSEKKFAQLAAGTEPEA